MRIGDIIGIVVGVTISLHCLEKHLDDRHDAISRQVDAFRKAIVSLQQAVANLPKDYPENGAKELTREAAETTEKPAAKAAQPEAPRMLGDFEHAAAPQRDRDGVGSGRPADVELVEEPGFDEGLLLGGEAVVERVVADDRAAADARKDGVGFLIHAKDSSKDHPGPASGQN